MIAVIDASVAVKWFIPEPDTTAAENVQRQARQTIALIIAEVANAAWRRARMGHVTKNHAEQIAAAIASRFDELVGLGELAHDAISIANQLDRPVYDCFYIALANRVGGQLVTADTSLVKSVQRTAWQRRVIALGAV